jgi:hypothetical protein
LQIFYHFFITMIKNEKPQYSWMVFYTKKEEA